jgi:hypothetical protein
LGCTTGERNFIIKKALTLLNSRFAAR